MLDFLDIVFQISVLAFLCGLFLRMGTVIEAIRGISERVSVLERWRETFHPSIITRGGR